MRLHRGSIRTLAVAWVTAALFVPAFLLRTALGADAPEEGSVAPADAWLTEGGCAARTGQSLARPLDGPVETAWTAELPAPLGCEPLAIGPWIVLDVAAPAGQRTLTFLQVTDGRVIAKRPVRTADPLLPSIAGPFVVVRSGLTKVSAFRVKGAQLIEAWTVDAGAPVRSLVAVAGEAFVRTDEAILRYDIGLPAVVWRRDSTVRGRLAVRGSNVFVVEYDDRGNSRLLALARDDGHPDSASPMGHHEGVVPTAGQDARIVVEAEKVHVLHGLPISTESGKGARLAEVERRALGRLGDAGLYASTVLPLPVPGGALVLSEDAQGSELSLRRPGGRGSLLASTKKHPEWLVAPELASSAGRVVYHPQGALELGQFRIVWKPKVPGSWTFRPVPTGDLVLVVEGPRTLRALRRKRTIGSDAAPGTAAPSPESIGPVAIGPGLPAAGADARAVLRDGSVVAGRMRRESGGFVLDAKPPRTIPAADVLVVETPEGKLLHAATGGDLAAGLATLADDRTGAAAGRILSDALASRDADLIRRLLSDAVRLGASQADLEKADKRVRDLLRPGKPLPKDAAAAAKAASQLAAAAAIPAEVARERLVSLPADAPREVAVDLLRIVLRRSPADADASARVRGMLPEGVKPAEPFDALEWLDFVEALLHTPVEVIRPVPANTPDMTAAQRAVGIQSVRWRGDVIGLKSRQLLVVTSAARPGAIARCLAMGELVCATLDGFFAGGTRKRDTREPLLLLLYPSKEEYERESARGGHTDVQWTAGHYSPGEELSRLYLPADDAGFDEVAGVFAHELTHQWIDQRCPYFGFVDVARGGRTPGCWIVEGFATFVEELVLDPRRRGWAFNPAASSLETVVVADASKLVPWTSLLGMATDEFGKLSTEPRYELPFVRRLGFFAKMSPKNMFYAQAGAVSAFLFRADGGAHRAKLLEYLAAHYRGKPLTIEDAFGMTPAELGTRVQAWARSSVLEAE